jgi:FixJ family two-component response regulator
MAGADRAKILIVDDEEAILETMTFTFMDDYEVLTANDAHRALEILDEAGPVAVVVTDQRMPNMTGVEFLSEVWRSHPETVRIILTGFADMDAIIQAINDGHVYAYITKPWEPDYLKQVVKHAVDHYALAVENARLLEDLKRSNVFLEAIMDRLPTGALAVDAEGVVQCANRPAREYLGLEDDPRGTPLAQLLVQRGLEGVGATVRRLIEARGGSFEDLEVGVGATAHRLRVSVQTLQDGAGDPDGRATPLGTVILFREVSHEPLARRLEELVAGISAQEEGLRPCLEQALDEIPALLEEVRRSGIDSPGMAELSERASRTQTALQNWLDVDDILAREDYPDAQSLLDRMRLATQRWPRPEELPARVRELAQRVEAYYESGENPKQRVL